ncbi:response regulator transcription factor [Nitratireductor aquimarinus]|uniref:Response regulator transcription factor n=1 Tax=Nitratireductor aquimarinus TaxID=889300 RepID=A0ABU4AQ12_9HYPH|nr:response regulator transcription factor [Nitratireductor aquimarinus]MDV6228326.1 response regulator transcription factor [Nitratireductor aquimarinus]
MTVVLIVDDHHLIRAGVKNLLESEFPDIRVEGADSVAAALRFLADIGDVDLVLMDLKLPDASELDGLTRLKQSHPASAVALISGTDDNETIRAALSIGADGFIPKSADPQILAHAVSLMLKGEMFLPRTFLQGYDPDGEVRAEERGRNVILTDRQCEVFTLMREGLANKEIARQLELSESTVKTHVSAILKSFGTTSRAKAIARAAERGWTQQ